jgi:transcriptional regulator with XRE-family HTH domain
MKNPARYVLRKRKKLGLTQTELAKKLGVAFATVNRWENSQNEPSPLALKELRRL